jgi:hypothetical protein
MANDPRFREGRLFPTVLNSKKRNRLGLAVWNSSGRQTRL